MKTAEFIACSQCSYWEECENKEKLDGCYFGEKKEEENMSNVKDALGDRMKENYENRSKTYLTRRVPVIIRLDGKAFHTFTRGFKRPCDEIFRAAMDATMKYLCENIQGCKLGYTQSDEITLLLTDFDKPTTDAWFDYSVQKMCSIAASMATLAFNRAFTSEMNKWGIDNLPDWGQGGTNQEVDTALLNIWSTYKNAINKGAFFDARCFSIPQEEVVNCFIWRQQDAARNAIQMLGQTYFNHGELHKKKTNEIQDMLMVQKGINFNDMPTEFKRGTCCVKELYQSPNVDIKDGTCTRAHWVVDKEIPIFTQDREYIESRMTRETL